MPNRTLCSVFNEMRKAYKTRNFSYLLGLIEEAQSIGNSMEAAIYDIGDIKRFREERSKLKKEIKELREQAGRDEHGDKKEAEDRVSLVDRISKLLEE